MTMREFEMNSLLEWVWANLFLDTTIAEEPKVFNKIVD